MENEIMKLINAKVIKVTEFEADSFDSGFILEFDNGMFLTAQDGEYGDNAFCFLSKEEVKRKVKKDA